MSYTIYDTPVNVTRYLPKLDGVEVIIRYITRGAPNGSKHVKLAEVKAIAAAGKQLAIVHETWGDFAHAGRGGISAADGWADGKYARAIMPKLGAPAGACVYFAVDTDATKSQIKNNLLPYFKAIREAFKDGEYRVGIYGPGTCCQAVLDAGYVDLCWLPNARGWSGYAAFLPKAAVVQRPVTRIAGGLDVDPNSAQVDDWGQFTPFSDDALAKPVADTLADVTADGNDTPPRLGQGEIAADTAGALATLGGEFDSVKSLFKSKIAWLTGSLGGGSAATAITSDPDTMGLMDRLVHKPVFWMAIAALVITGLVVYYRWRDHGRGAAS